ncbi:MAG TPA: sigma-70 family RNA polymerase sigma factor [Gemmatales bacterium]|nr:sigma-70 family RNA polymerase sigma factor [Gemmatales bacterium]HMP59401.1 sigma-70 family RNA polymerase sigma factor [Gemmatales bacterium]
MADDHAGTPWEFRRQYLVLLTRDGLGAGLVGKVDPSGIVQQTLLEAHQAGGLFARLAPEQQLAWLRTALGRNLRDEVRRWRSDKRDVAREQALDAALDASASRVESWLAADEASPSQHAVQHEQWRRLATALAELPPAQREVVELHYLHGLTVPQLATRLGRTPAAVAGLLKRGLAALRQVTSPSNS